MWLIIIIAFIVFILISIFLGWFIYTYHHGPPSKFVHEGSIGARIPEWVARKEKGVDILFSDGSKVKGDLIGEQGSNILVKKQGDSTVMKIPREQFVKVSRTRSIK